MIASDRELLWADVPNAVKLDAQRQIDDAVQREREAILRLDSVRGRAWFEIRGRGAGAAEIADEEAELLLAAVGGDASKLPAILCRGAALLREAEASVALSRDPGCQTHAVAPHFAPPDSLPSWAVARITRASGLYEGQCEHGIGHPIGTFPEGYGVHGCDGCCAPGSGLLP